MAYRYLIQYTYNESSRTTIIDVEDDSHIDIFFDTLCEKLNIDLNRDYIPNIKNINFMREINNDK